jgi:hypothetical protein
LDIRKMQTDLLAVLISTATLKLIKEKRADQRRKQSKFTSAFGREKKINFFAACGRNDQKSYRSLLGEFCAVFHPGQHHKTQVSSSFPEGR